MTVAQALEIAVTRLAAAGVDGARNESTLLLRALLDASRSEIILQRNRVLSETQQVQLLCWLERRESREPLQHILGRAHFYGLELSVTPQVLIPRPETERLVELVLDEIKAGGEPKLLDVGTGSGAVAVALKHERPDAQVMATDSSAAALAVAEVNAQRLGLSVAFVLSDLLAAEPVRIFAEQTDVLVANMPYLPESDRATLSPEVQRDPATALYSGVDGLDHFRRLEAQAYVRLKPGALCLLELDPRNVQAAARRAERWTETKTYADLVGRLRFLRLER